MNDNRQPSMSDFGYGKHSIEHNPGRDFLRLVFWMEQIEHIDPGDPNLPFASYMIPIIAILGACCALEGYVNMVGQKADSNWAKFEKQPRNQRIKARISHIYTCIGMKVDFGQGTWQKTLDLFDMRNQLVHPTYVKETQKSNEQIPTIFQEASAKYPPSESKRLIEEAIDLLLLDTNLTELREKWISRSYSERL